MTADDISRYRQDGFVVIPQFLSTEQCEALKMRAEHVVEKWVVSDQAMKLAQDQSAVFTTENNDRTNNHFFLDSAEITTSSICLMLASFPNSIFKSRIAFDFSVSSTAC